MAGGKSGICRLINFIISVAFFGIGVYVFWIFLGRPDVEDVQDFGGSLGDNFGNLSDFGDFTDVLGNLTGDYGGLYDTDPFLSDNTTSSWPKNGGNGLTLEMYNALDDTWQDEFDAAISDWENGDPDALTLEVKQVDVDHSCQPEGGVMKVCNGNFGETGWLGLNELVKKSSNGIIQNSVAKMNEYYLLNADDDERQYTMCHEIGHGFGLPHTDENFQNADLGNCLDYTLKPQNNLHPDEGNYKRLQGLYGTVPNRRLRSSRTRKSRILTPELRAEYDLAISELEQVRREPNNRDSKWRLLRDHSRGGDYVRRLDEEYTLEVHMLYAMPN